MPLSPGEREQIGVDARQRLFADQEAPTASVSLAEAIARSVKYYADFRLRTMEEALADAQLDVSRFDLLPRLTASAGYTTRNNDSFGFGFSQNGTIAANPSASSERTRNTLNLGFTWSVLDFGVSYFKAKQQADQVLVARERRHKAVQILVHDVRRAWWRAEAAQRLLPAMDKLLADIDGGLERTRIIEARKLLPPTQVVSLRRSMLELQQQISFRRQELAQAAIELSALINLPPGTAVKLESVPLEARKVLELGIEPDRLDTVALNSRPELAEEGYRARISEAETKKALLALIPNLSFDLGLSYDSNRFLVNNLWSTAGLNIAFNLVKAFSLPAVKRSGEAQRQVDEARRLAMAMAILTQTRIATVRYSLVAHEYSIWDEAARDDEQIVKLLSSSALVGIDSELELMRARSRAMISSINRDLSYANLEATVAQLYQSIGYDAVADESEEKLTVAGLSKAVESRLGEFRREVFTERAGSFEVSVAMGPVSGVEPGEGALLTEGMNRVFSLSHVRMVDPDKAQFRVSLHATLQPPRSGSQPARVEIRVLDGPSGAERRTDEFKTTLSAPVDEEQLRVLGEGAAYRILIALPSGRSARTGSSVPAGTKVSQSTPVSEAAPVARIAQVARKDEGDRLPVVLDGGYLGLSMDTELRSVGRLSVSSATLSDADALARSLVPAEPMVSLP